MRKIILFGSKHCPDCGPAKEYLSNHDIKFAYLDISEKMFNLKTFLKYRDNYDEFKEVKEAGIVGIPCIVINSGEQIIFDYNEFEI